MKYRQYPSLKNAHEHGRHEIGNAKDKENGTRKAVEGLVVL